MSLQIISAHGTTPSLVAVVQIHISAVLLSRFQFNSDDLSLSLLTLSL